MLWPGEMLHVFHQFLFLLILSLQLGVVVVFQLEFKQKLKPGTNLCMYEKIHPLLSLFHN